ncbi:type I HSP40 co-chaperone YDJ1 protein [Rutstroemia sp. NJR-2017a BVV2]|nr:type I HSP40 co-chaperone YDJ1 protein [Rutstroemia sp. NJR-2017a BVV2]
MAKVAQPFTDFYAVLSIPHTATSKDVKKAYKALALRWHPDKNPHTNTTTKFQQLQRAVDTLSDPMSRACHDADLYMRGLFTEPFPRTPSPEQEAEEEPSEKQKAQDAWDEWARAHVAEERRKEEEEQAAAEERRRAHADAKKQRSPGQQAPPGAEWAYADVHTEMAIKEARARNMREWDGNWMKMLAFKKTVVAEYTRHLQSYLRRREVCISEIKRQQFNIHVYRRGKNPAKYTAEELLMVKQQDARMLEHFTSFQKMSRNFEMEQAQLCRAWAQKYLMMIPAHDPVLLKAQVKDVFHSARKFWQKLLDISTSILVEDKNNDFETKDLDVSKLWYKGPPGTRATNAPRLPTELEAIHKLWDYKTAEGAWHKSSDQLIRNAWVPEPGEHSCGRCSRLTTHSAAKKQAGICTGCEMVACGRCISVLVVLRDFEIWTETEEMAWGSESDI